MEKVRATLGTGSPNTVTRMLDVWRGQLGARLRQLSALPELPTPVGQAMMTRRQLATDHASRAIAGRYTEERAALEVARDALATERQEWTIRLEAAESERARAQAVKDLAEHALDAQLQDSHALRADLAQQRDRLQAQCDQLSTEVQGMRAQLSDQQQAAAEERARQEAYVRNLQDRAYQEVDRLRQESKQWQQRLETAERTNQESERLLQLDQNSLRDQLRSAEQAAARHAGQVAALEKALSETRAKSAPKRPLGKSAQRADNSSSKKSVGPRSQPS